MDVNLFGELVHDSQDGRRATKHYDPFDPEFDLSEGERTVVADFMKRFGNQLHNQGDDKRGGSLWREADRYEYCRKQETGHYCERCRSAFATRVVCRSRVCDHCGRVYMKKLLKRIVPIVKRATARRKTGWVLGLVTMTVQTGRWGEKMPDRDDIKRLYKETSQFLRLHYGKYPGVWTKTGKIRENRKRKINAGWIATLEVGADNNNAHCHALVYGPIRSLQKMRRDWTKITGDSWNVHIKAIRDPATVVKYILKYISKPPATDSYQRVAEYAMMIKGSRRLRSGGIFYNAFVDRSETPICCCPVCSGTIKWEGPLYPHEWGTRPDLWKSIREADEAFKARPMTVEPAAPREAMSLQLPLWQ
jgi:hypothetical protein